MRGKFWLAFPGTLLLLSLWGVALIYSSGAGMGGGSSNGLWARQLAVLGIGVLGYLAISRISVSLLEWLALPAYLLAVGALALTLIVGMGAGTAASTTSFIEIQGFRFQPAEAAKVATALALAAVLSHRPPPRTFRELIPPAAIAGLPFCLTALQPDLGTALSFAAMLVGVLFWAGVPKRLLFVCLSPVFAVLLSFNNVVWAVYIVLLAAACCFGARPVRVARVALIVGFNVLAGSVARVLWGMLAPYQKNRLLVFLDPSLDPLGAGWQLTQSKVAIGSGGLLGKGYLEGTQNRLNFLPEPHTDFIFAIVGEEFGFLGALLTLAAFGFVFHLLIRVASLAVTRFAEIFAISILCVWMTHAAINVAMTIGRAPVIGIPLPFLSYGGSFLLTSWLAAGLVNRLGKDRF